MLRDHMAKLATGIKISATVSTQKSLGISVFLIANAGG